MRMNEESTLLQMRNVTSSTVVTEREFQVKFPVTFCALYQISFCPTDCRQHFWMLGNVELQLDWCVKKACVTIAVKSLSPEPGPSIMRNNCIRSKRSSHPCIAMCLVLISDRVWSASLKTREIRWTTLSIVLTPWSRKSEIVTQSFPASACETGLYCFWKWMFSLSSVCTRERKNNNLGN